MCVGIYREAQRALAAEKEWKERALKLEQQNKVLQQTLKDQDHEEKSKQEGSGWKQKMLQWREKSLEYEERNQSMQQRLEKQAQEHEKMKTEVVNISNGEREGNYLADLKRLLQKAREELQALAKKAERDKLKWKQFIAGKKVQKRIHAGIIMDRRLTQKRSKTENQNHMYEQVVAVKEADKKEGDATSSGTTGKLRSKPIPKMILKPPTKSILLDDTQATAESALEFTEFYVPNNLKMAKTSNPKAPTTTTRNEEMRKTASCERNRGHSDGSNLSTPGNKKCTNLKRKCCEHEITRRKRPSKKRENFSRTGSSTREPLSQVTPAKLNAPSTGSSGAKPVPPNKSRFTVPKPKEIACLPVVRRKAEREAMKGFACSQCEAWYNEVKDTVDDAELLGRNLCDHVSRHRRNFDIPKSPEGFWDISFSNDEPS
eukprot:jgi/Bigna1/125938/aug1.1_g646